MLLFFRFLTLQFIVSNLHILYGKIILFFIELAVKQKERENNEHYAFIGNRMS